ncbi:MAG: proprotein convertase P-domain-containing protein [Planctomycetota bacterium]|jgi:subtilisin-like proprotein convertase family protein
MPNHFIQASVACTCLGLLMAGSATNDDPLKGPEALSVTGDASAVGSVVLCDLPCPPGALEEQEPCGSDLNGGCNVAPPAFEDAACGDVICGTAWADGGSRDTDWFLVAHGGGILNSTLVSQFEGVNFIVDVGGGDCSTIAVVGDIGCSNACLPIADASADVPAGNWVIFVATGLCSGGGIFEGYPCGGGFNDYVLEICPGTETGACCLEDGTCVDGTTQEFCEAPPLPGCGDCDMPDPAGNPGCSDPVCEAIVCGVDPFCCDVAWDGICAGEAQELCDCGTGGLGGEWAGLDTFCPDACGPVIPTGGCCQCDDEEVQFCTVETEEDCGLLGGEYLGDDAACESGGGMFYFESSPAADIPDNDQAGVSDTIVVGDSFSILDLDVDLTINHTWVGDLCVTLSKDGGPAVELIRRAGLDDDTCGPGSCCGCSENDYAGIILDDEGAGGAIEAACAPSLSSPPNYTPNNPLSFFDGMDAAGAWTLTVNDGAGGDTGTLVTWSLSLEGPAGGDSPCAVAFPDQCVTSVPRTLIIKQGACPAPVNAKSNGLTPMALVGDVDFDVSLVDPATIELRRCDGIGGAAYPFMIHIRDLNHPNYDDIGCGDDQVGCACNEDQSSDGIGDLAMKFKTADMSAALELGTVVQGEVISLVLTGESTDGTGFEAVDCILVIGGTAVPALPGGFDSGAPGWGLPGQ